MVTYDLAGDEPDISYTEYYPHNPRDKPKPMRHWYDGVIPAESSVGTNSLESRVEPRVPIRRAPERTNRH